MPLPTASDNKWPKLVIAEAGALGTAAAGERRLGIDANGVLVWKDSAGLTSPLVALNKWDGTTAPTANEDSGDGYSVGSRWIDTTNDKEYVCLDATLTAAVWTETTGAAGGGGIVASARAKESATITLTTTAGDITGATITATPAVTETWMVWAMYDFAWTTASAGNIAVGSIVFSGTGTVANSDATFQGNVIGRATVTNFALITGVDAAAHTVKLQALKTAAGGTAGTSGTSSIMILRYAE